MAVTTLAVASVAVGAGSAALQKRSADKAAKAQRRAADAGIGEQQRQFDAIQELLKPYVTAGEDATDAQRAFFGLAGADAERAAVRGIEESETFKAGIKQGETAILQNASATGGLRGGNTQGALATFRPTLLNQVIAQRVAGLGDIASRGQASAAGQAAAGQNNANAIASLLQDQGAAQAGAALARGKAVGDFGNTLAQAGGTLAGYYASRPPPPTIVDTPNPGGRNFVDTPIAGPVYGSPTRDV